MKRFRYHVSKRGEPSPEPLTDFKEGDVIVYIFWDQSDKWYKMICYECIKDIDVVDRKTNRKEFFVYSPIITLELNGIPS